ncbi:MAG: arginyl-tRNA synthetase [Verrucomicrobia bacterium]|nr:MAG: arginyl-tRNA synthetase [Verrucomicrobiota bacterium]
METIPSILEQRLRTAVEDPGQTPLSITSASDSRFGDYQSNAAMLLAKQRRANPRGVAQEILEKLRVDDICSSVEIAGAGFLNFRLRPEWVQERVLELTQDPRLGVPAPARPLGIVVDFSSPNVAKPMHVGHIRSTILGDSLARIASFIGHRVVRDNHIGDWGTQFGMLLLGWKTILNKTALEQDPLLEMERIYKDVSARCREDVAVLEKARHELVLLQAGDAGNLLLWKEMIRLSQSQFDAIYGRLGVLFDVTLGESFYNERLKSVVEALQAAQIARESDGAICVFSDGRLPQEEDVFLIKDKDGWRDNPAIVLKSDGAANYMTTDVATLQYRIETWQPDEIIYVTDGRQQLHFRQMFSIFRRWKADAAAAVRLSHVWFGSILGDDGRPFKTRSGETVRLADLLDEAEERSFAQVSERNPSLPEEERREIARIIGIGAVKYADLLPHRQGDYTFSWERMLSFQGNTAPYLQNAYVRIRSIFRRLAEAGESWRPGGGMRLEHPAEVALGKRLLEFGEVLPQVLQDHRPNTLANYLYELANTFHAFYEACPVLKSAGDQRASRLELCELSARMLKSGLGLLGIEVPEKM